MSFHQPIISQVSSCTWCSIKQIDFTIPPTLRHAELWWRISNLFHTWLICTSTRSILTSLRSKILSSACHSGSSCTITKSCLWFIVSRARKCLMRLSKIIFFSYRTSKSKLWGPDSLSKRYSSIISRTWLIYRRWFQEIRFSFISTNYWSWYIFIVVLSNIFIWTRARCDFLWR